MRNTLNRLGDAGVRWMEAKTVETQAGIIARYIVAPAVAAVFLWQLWRMLNVMGTAGSGWMN